MFHLNKILFLFYSTIVNLFFINVLTQGKYIMTIWCESETSLSSLVTVNIVELCRIILGKPLAYMIHDIVACIF